MEPSGCCQTPYAEDATSGFMRITPTVDICPGCGRQLPTLCPCCGRPYYPEPQPYVYWPYWVSPPEPVQPTWTCCSTPPPVQ